MSIESALENAKQKITNAYSVIKNKGGTLPVVQNLDNLSKTIGNISNTLNSGGEYLVKVIDYDGTVLKSDYLNTGATFTLPSQPTHEGLTFQGWSSSAVITNNTITVSNDNIVIGAVYTTTSGLSEFDITLTRASGLSVTLNMNGTKNWGDGTSNTETTHTYSTVGDYTITCDGKSIVALGLFGQSNSSSIHTGYSVKKIRLGNNFTTITANAFQYCYSLESITIPNSVTDIKDKAFYECSSLKSIIIPDSITDISSSNSVFAECCSLNTIATSINFHGLGTDAFKGCNSLKNIPTYLSNTSSGMFASCHCLESAKMQYMSTVPDSTFSNCNSLKKVILNTGGTGIGKNAFDYCYSLEDITFDAGTIGSGAFFNCISLKTVKCKTRITHIDSDAFKYCQSVIEYDFSNATSVPTLSNTNAFTDINKICKIKVPSSLEASWKAATNWATYADYIVGV